MRFYSRQGVQIERDEWERLIREPTYVGFLWHTYNGVTVRTSWLGVMLESFEDIPTVFVTVVKRENAGKELRERAIFHTTTDTEKLKALHNAECVSAGIPAWALQDAAVKAIAGDDKQAKRIGGHGR